jgi:y4mF family transcriptional regulator
MKTLAEFVKDRRKKVGLTQQELAERAGVALTVIRKIEQKKENLNLEKVNQVLKMFGHVLVPVDLRDKSGLEKKNP